jgi:hypothetical protein
MNGLKGNWPNSRPPHRTNLRVEVKSQVPVDSSQSPHVLVNEFVCPCGVAMLTLRVGPTR